MKKILISLAVPALMTASSSYGTVYFRNSGNVNGWNNTSTDNNCYLSSVSSPSYGSSGGSIEAQAYYRGSGVRYHAEPTTYGSWNSGTTYFGYALYLDPSWDFNGTDRNVTEQYGTVNSSGGVITPDFYQAWVKNNNYQFSAVNGSDETSGSLGSGQWHTIVTKMTYGSGGNVTVWFDGNQVWSVNGTVNGGGGGNPRGLWALGLYEADWDGGNTGNGTAQILYDAGISIASDYNDANPIQNFGGGGGISGTHVLTVECSGDCLNDPGDSTANGTDMIQWTYGTSANEEWTFNQNSDGSYTLVNAYSGLVLDDPGSNGSNGTPVDQWSSNGGSNQHWRVNSLGGGYYEIQNVATGLVLDDPGSSTTAGQKLDLWSWNGGSNQYWYIH